MKFLIYLSLFIISPIYSRQGDLEIEEKCKILHKGTFYYIGENNDYKTVHIFEACAKGSKDSFGIGFSKVD